MEEYLAKCWAERGVSQNSIKLYLFQLRQLGGDYENLDFLKDVERILKKLERIFI